MPVDVTYTHATLQFLFKFFEMSRLETPKINNNDAAVVLVMASIVDIIHIITFVFIQTISNDLFLIRSL